MARTRKQHAETLADMLVEGPSLTISEANAGDLTREQRQDIEQDMERRVRLWLDAWVLPEIAALVRELPVRPDA
jgi:gamma-glutamyl phosphate reductase